MGATDMKSLDEIAIEHQTDRASVFTRIASKAHDYARHYEKAFASRLEFFPMAQVFGVDNRQGTNPWDTVGAKTHGRYTFVYGDQSSETFWECFKADYGKDFDIIIDDGGHFNDQIIITFQRMWEALSPGGFYAIEDLGCGYSPGSIFVREGWGGHPQLLHDKVDSLHTGGPIDSIYMGNELAILRKAIK
jgi:hypothetical protein